MLGLYTVFKAGRIFLQIIETAILVYCVLSWFQPRFKLFYMLRQFIQPFISPFQVISLKLMRYFRAPVDITCLLALIAIPIIERIWMRLYVIIATLIY